MERKSFFSFLEDIHKLAVFKKEIRDYKVARDEEGLQIIDTDYRLPLLRIPTRLKYTTRPEKLAELKQIKGKFKEFLCTYRLEGAGANTELTIDLRVRLPYGPLGFILSPLFKPLMKSRLKNEIRTLEERINH